MEATPRAVSAPDVAKQAPSDKAAPAPDVVPPPAPAPDVVPPPAAARPDAQETRDPMLRGDDIAPLPPPPPGRFGPAQTLGGSSMPFGEPVGESPQRFAVELKFGPYLPAIDHSVGLAGKPFQDLFGVNPDSLASGWRVLSQLEFDYQFLRLFGTLGAGLSVGYYRISAPQPVYSDVLDKDGKPMTDAVGRIKSVCSGTAACFSGDENHFNLVPLEALLVYRFDYLARRFRIPIIPYIKGGFAYYIWWNGTSGSFVATQRYVRHSDDGYYHELAQLEQKQVSGASFGLAVHPGIAIDLGVIDRQAARVMDRELGVNRVSLIGELNYAYVNNFGHGYHLNLSNTSFNVGLLMEF